MRQHDWLVQQLPVGMAEDPFLVQFLRIFQDVADSVLTQADNVPHLFDVSVAPDAMVRAMGAWVGLDWVDPSMPDLHQRTMVRRYSSGLLWRGTKAALIPLLEVMCGTPVRVIDSGGIYARDGAPDTTPHVRVEVPSRGQTTEADLVRIVRSELPASVTFELAVGGRTIHPQAQPEALTASVI